MIKAGAKINGIKPEIVLGLFVVRPLFDKYGVELIMTEGTGGKHSSGSLHYAGLAVDLRSKHVIGSAKQQLLLDCRTALGNEFDMILEDIGGSNEHYHLEYQPK